MPPAIVWFARRRLRDRGQLVAWWSGRGTTSSGTGTLRMVVATLLNTSRIAGGHTTDRVVERHALHGVRPAAREVVRALQEALDIAVEDRTAAAANGSATGTLSALTGAGVPEFGYISDLRLAFGRRRTMVRNTVLTRSRSGGR